MTRGLRRRSKKIAFHHSFGRPMSTKRREGCAGSFKIRISPQFRTSDEHEVTRGWSPVLIDQTHPALKKKENFKEVLIHIHSQQIFSADFLQQIFFSRSSQQIFLADLLSRSSQQIFSAEFLSRSSQRIFSADLLSRSSQQIFSFAVVRGWWSAIVLSFSSFAVVRGCWSAIVLSFSSFAMVRGWWSAIVLSFAVVRGWWSAIVLSFAVVRGWWSAIVLSCWWSILHEFFRRTLSRSFREKEKGGQKWPFLKDPLLDPFLDPTFGSILYLLIVVRPSFARFLLFTHGATISMPMLLDWADLRRRYVLTWTKPAYV